jgi:hypothetical protein
MKKTLLLLTVFLSITLFSCKEEELINGGSKNTNTPTTGTTTTKCYVREITGVQDGETFKTIFTYNTKNLLQKIEDNRSIMTYEYDANNRPIKLSIVYGDAKEIFTYNYDAKGNITSVKYDAINVGLDLSITEYKFTTNSSGQVTKVVGVSEDGDFEFELVYDSKNNLKKLNLIEDGDNTTILENITFDDKVNAYSNTGLSKAQIPLVLVGAIFGANLSHYMNTNNILADKTNGVFGEVSIVYDYGYNKDGQPSKMNITVTAAGTDNTTGNVTYTYDCK